jgi:hypothetical protein
MALVTPVLLIASILIAFDVLFPALSFSGVSLLTAIAIGAAGFAALYIGFELEVVSHLLARLVGRHWAAEVERDDSWLRHFFYLEDNNTTL